MVNYKQVILVRQDLKLPKGKLVAQCCHASIEAALKSSDKKISAWRKEGSIQDRSESERRERTFKLSSKS